MSLFIVARYARADQVLPGIRSSLCLGDHMIYGHRPPRSPTILTAMSIPFQDIPLGEDDLLVGYLDI